MRIFSNGGGVQSTAALILSAQGKIEFQVHLFSNVGDDSEYPDTLRYVREVAMPYAKANDIEFHEIKRQTNNGETLYQRTLRQDRSIKIPIVLESGAFGHRSCTQDYKRDVIKRWLGVGEHTIGLGISLDEFHRMRTNSGYKNIVNEYPLIDLRLTRADCLKIIRDAGLSQPHKSSCWFCPFHKISEWQEMRRNNPILFDKAVELENILGNKRIALGRDRVWLTTKMRPLSEIIGDQPTLFEIDDNCDSGYCMT